MEQVKTEEMDWQNVLQTAKDQIRQSIINKKISLLVMELAENELKKLKPADKGRNS